VHTEVALCARTLGASKPPAALHALQVMKRVQQVQPAARKDRILKEGAAGTG